MKKGGFTDKMKKIALILPALLLLISACGDNTPTESVTPVFSEETIEYSSAESDDSSLEETSFSDDTTSEESKPVTVTDNRFVVGKLEMPLFAEFTSQLVDDFDLYAYNDIFALTVVSEKISDLQANSDKYTVSNALDYTKLFTKDMNTGTPIYYNEDCTEVWFEYTQHYDYGSYRYFAFCFQGSDAYYMCQFVCDESDADVHRDTIKSCVTDFVVG